ncbi:circadian clock KaiB family protein [Caenimonas aquaedulcis]|uniref:Circadian clock KaiB family protein n=1 Tax=Caenimonas aquaedulcis TaxID=2793270 RepID=A0A931H8J3_9BURK|nr:circadian clock KaiB family protein [Caenimonas aquaedulcis]MBG9390696.1 circadian clock KaiB family protein [Caenimonas aquaedulcis]
MTRKPAHAATQPKSPACECLLRLYVSAAAPMSARAVVNTRAFCEAHLAGRYELQILSISENVEQASLDEIIAAPTLLRVWPLPARRFIGDMSNAQRLLDGLNIRPAGRS